MYNRRAEQRMLCADLVDIHWKTRDGRVRHAVANLEDISVSGACIQVEQPVAPATVLRISYPKGELLGRVCYCVYREIGYFLGVEFDSANRWSPAIYRPQHLLDPRRIVGRAPGSTGRAPELRDRAVITEILQ
jgi:hypothetical protein